MRHVSWHGINHYDANIAAMQFKQNAKFWNNHGKNPFLHCMISFSQETAPTADDAMRLTNKIIEPLTENHFALSGVHNEERAGSSHHTHNLLNIIDTLNNKGVTLISHKESIDTNSPTGKFLLTVFAALPQLEREQLKQRQREGIEIAKTQGKYTGRKPIPIDWERFGKLYGEWKAKNITGRDFMRRIELSANTFYRRVRKYEIRNGIVEPTSA